MKTQTTVKQKPSVPHKELGGKRFGTMTAIERVGSKGRNALWRVLCDCGKEKVKTSCILKHAMFCGYDCSIGRSYRAQNMSTHRLAFHPAYRVWRSMKQRCTNPKAPKFYNYGGRGIKVCASWLSSFENFWRDMGASWVEGLQLDRINNEGGYEPSNCRWATRKENARNKRTSKTPGWALDLKAVTGMSPSTFYSRVSRGWSVAAACTVPPHQKPDVTP